MGANPGVDDRVARYREMWSDEMAGAAMYRMLAEHADDAKGAIFLRLAEAEERHAGHWAALLAEAGVTDLKAPPVSFRTRTLRFMARRFGTDAVLPIVLRQEIADANKYRGVPEAPPEMAASEMAHGRTLSAMQSDTTAGDQIVRAEGRHRANVGGALRPAVFGMQDGLISNFLLVMGVAGGTENVDVVVLAGVAALLAGAFSMAAGEWNSVRTQRELFEREIAVEAEEMAAFPEEEEEELSLIYQAKGIPASEADLLAAQIMKNPATALDTLAREELGLDPAALGSAGVAASSSAASFAIGAFIPLLPFLVTSGGSAIALAASLSAMALLGVGALTSIFTGVSAWRTGVRMLLIGSAASGISYGVGTLIGVNVG